MNHAVSHSPEFQAKLDIFSLAFPIELFSPIELETLMGLCRMMKCQNGQVLYYEGQELHDFYIVDQGKIKLNKTSSDGREVILKMLSRGDVFADFLFFCDAYTYQANATCVQKSSVLAIHGYGFKELIMSKPDILLSMNARFSSWIKDFNRLIGDLSLKSVNGRLAKYLLTMAHLSDAHSLDHPIVLSIPRKTLAAILGTIPETLSRALKKLCQDNVIVVDHQTITILDYHALEHLAETTLAIEKPSLIPPI